MPAYTSNVQADFRATFERVAHRYRGCGRFAHRYVAAKLHRDPVHREVMRMAARETFGDVVDLGCGRGQLAIALLEAGLASSVWGLDRNPAHLDQARRAAGGLAFEATVRDLAVRQDIPATATVLLIDVLYQLEPRSQLALLHAAARAARQRVVIRTLDPARGLRSILTLTLEWLMRPLSPHSGRNVAALPIARLAGILAHAGFVVSSTPCWEGTPFANVLVIGRRAGQDSYSHRTLADAARPIRHQPCHHAG
jgi:SAM-dependent methyltransferase